MLVTTGFFDSGSNPCLKLTISGIFTNTPQEFEGIIDTGFTGFISMPMIKAFPLGLVLSGTTNVTLADGNSYTKLLAMGYAGIMGLPKQEIGAVILEWSNTDILLGMDFLRKFKLSLHISNNRIELHQDIPTIKGPLTEQISGE